MDITERRKQYYNDNREKIKERALRYYYDIAKPAMKIKNDKILLKQQEKQLKENIKEQKERWKAEKDKLLLKKKDDELLLKNKCKEEEEESDIDKLVKQSLYGGEEETSGEVDYSELTPRELTELIDDALDAGDYERVKMLSQYMKEGKEIYLKELERINEGHNFHTRRK